MILSFISPLPELAESNFAPQSLQVQMLQHRSASDSTTPQHLALSGTSEECLHICYGYHSSPMAGRLFLKTAFVFRTPSTRHSPIHKLQENVMLGLG